MPGKVISQKAMVTDIAMKGTTSTPKPFLNCGSSLAMETNMKMTAIDINATPIVLVMFILQNHITRFIKSKGIASRRKGRDLNPR